MSEFSVSTLVTDKKEAEDVVVRLTKELEYAKGNVKHLEEKIVLLTQMNALKQEIKKQSPDHFDTWVKARVRVDKESDVQSAVTDIWRSYKYWYNWAAPVGRKFSQAEFIRKCEEVFGEPKSGDRRGGGKFYFYSGMFVFDTDEDVEAFDHQKDLETSKSHL